MPAPAVGTPVRVLWGGLGYPIAVPGLVLATQDSWTEDAAPDMPPVDGPDVVHIAVFVASGGGLASFVITNIEGGGGANQFTIA
jgi:hypothetical protein